MLNLFMNGDFYIGISIGAFVCYLFFSSCFISVPGDEAVVRYLRIILYSLLCWTGGSVLMRLKISPGMEFWYQFSLLGLFLIPLGIYGFVFCVLHITGKKSLLDFCMLLSVAAILLNGFTGWMLPAPAMRILPDGSISYIYQSQPGIWLWLAAESLLLIYVTVLAHRKIGTHYEERHKLAPLLLGTLLLFTGNITCLMPWGGKFPYDDLGGICLAICLAYTIYKQYFFSLRSRITVGVAYFTAAFVAFFPIAVLGYYMDRVTGEIGSAAKQSLLVLVTMEGFWCILVLAFARKTVERHLFQKRKYIVESLTEFQNSVTAVVSKKELYQLIRETIGKAIPDSHVHIFEEREGHIIACTANGDQSLRKEEEERLQQLLITGTVYKDPAVALFKFDNKIFGFLHVELHRKSKLIYNEADCIRQIGNSVSSVLKSINAYERLYQVSIHDGLTGLYNWNFCQESLKKLDIAVYPVGMIYLDMDNFKLYNELYGENTGDQVLRWCAGQIQSLVGEKMQVFRVGSNEFLILAMENDKNKLIALAKQIQSTILEAKEDKPKVIQLITFSIGIAWDRTLAENAAEMFHEARRSAFYAKENGKNRIEVYEKDLEGVEQNSEKGYSQVSPTIFALMAAVDAKDSFTFEHSENVSKYAAKLAAKLRLPQEDIQTAKVAGLLHDIGKIGIPESILKKKGKLTKEEYAQMKTHVEKSVEMIRFLPDMNYVIPAVVSHHERYDGTGYPNGIKGKEIPLLGRILAVCDSFDAMVSRRVYKDRMSVEYAVKELEQGKGTQFDPEVAQAFIELIEEDPSFIVRE